MIFTVGDAVMVKTVYFPPSVKLFVGVYVVIIFSVYFSHLNICYSPFSFSKFDFQENSFLQELGHIELDLAGTT